MMLTNSLQFILNNSDIHICFLFKLVLPNFISKAVPEHSYGAVKDRQQ